MASEPCTISYSGRFGSVAPMYIHGHNACMPLVCMHSRCICIRSPKVPHLFGTCLVNFAKLRKYSRPKSNRSRAVCHSRSQYWYDFESTIKLSPAQMSSKNLSQQKRLAASVAGVGKRKSECCRQSQRGKNVGKREKEAGGVKFVLEVCWMSTTKILLARRGAVAAGIEG